MNSSPLSGATAVRQRWLWIVGELTHELTTGLLVYSANLARAVASQGVDVTMVGLADPARSSQGVEPRLVSVGRGGVRTVPVSDSMRGGVASVLSSLPNLAFATGTAAMRDAVVDLLRKRWDVVVIDHLQAAWTMPLVRDLHDGVTVFVTHNHEGSMRADVARQAPRWNGRRALLGRDAKKAAALERATLATAGVVTAITDLDARRFAGEVPGLRCLVLPPGWSGPIDDARPQRRPIVERPRRVGIVGSFEWHVKQENLRRFVEVADPVFAGAGVELVVGGRVADGMRQRLEAGTSATRFLGWVEDLDELLDDVRIGVVSEPLGGGFKLKTLDYVFRGVPLAALSSSRAGVPVVSGESVIEAASERELADAIVAAIDDTEGLEAIADRAYLACKDAFVWSDRGRLLVDQVRVVAGQR